MTKVLRLWLCWFGLVLVNGSGLVVLAKKRSLFTFARVVLASRSDCLHMHTFDAWLVRRCAGIN